MTHEAASGAAPQHLRRTVLMGGLHAAVTVEADGAITGWNATAARLFGWDGRTKPGGDLRSLFRPDFADAAAEALATVRNDRPRRMLAIAQRADSSRFIAELAIAPVHDGGSTASDFALSFRDVTTPVLVRAASTALDGDAEPETALSPFARALAQLVPLTHLSLVVVEGGEFRHAWTGSPNGGGPFDATDRLPVAGHPLELAIRRRRSVVVADTMLETFPGDDAAAAGGVRSYVVTPFVRGDRVFAALIARFKEPYACAPPIVRLLQAVIAELAPVLNNLLAHEAHSGALRQLERVDILRNEFLTLITHDMRTPLSVIAGFAESLRSRWEDLPEEEKLESVDAILRNGRNLVRMVEEGLQIALLEAGTFEYALQPFDVVAQIRRTAADLSGHTSPARIRVTADPPAAVVRADPDRHWQVFTNLVSNAIKFSPQDAPVDVTVARRQDEVQVSVRDYGRGIESEDLPKLFRKLGRVGTASEREVRGTGLGLFICKALVEAQGGRIWVETELGVGSTFSYTLRVAPACDEG